MNNIIIIALIFAFSLVIFFLGRGSTRTYPYGNFENEEDTKNLVKEFPLVTWLFVTIVACIVAISLT